MKKLRRDFFFWIERLQITRKERVVISSLLVIVVLMTVLTAFLQQKYNYSQEEYDAILAEFEKKSAAIRKEQEKDLAKYSGQNNERKAEKNDPVTLSPNLININTAGVDELQKLNGIGKTYAQRIVDYRTENGEFTTVEDLLNVRGIGKKRLEQIEKFVTIRD